jgi:CheY-like chemotaxis protein
MTIRLLVLARRPIELNSLPLDQLGADLADSLIIRRPSAIEAALEDFRPDVALVDTSYEDGKGFEAMSEILARDEDVRVVALTPDPPSLEDIAFATRAGAVGFIDTNAASDEAAEALLVIADGGTWVPEALTRTALAQAADDLDVTADERRSRLNSILIAMIPIVGILTAALSFLWREYLSTIGVRPVDIAIDPGSRVIDALITLSVLLGVFGPLAFIRTWLEQLRRSPANSGPIGWLLERHALAWTVAAAMLLTAIAFLLAGTKVAIVVVIGPLVAVAMIARGLDLDEVLPAALRIKASPARTLVGGAAVLVLCLAALTVEVVAVGPQFGTKGAEGVIAPTVLGFGTQPMRWIDVDAGGKEQDVLYLGGNADLYVLIDPCNDDETLFVSVGATRLVVIDEVSCP